MVAHRTFTKTAEGRRYDNGMLLRKGNPVQSPWMRPYFPRGNYHFPYYAPVYSSTTVVISPYGFYFGVCAPYINRAHIFRYQPDFVYIDSPIYSGSDFRNFTPIRDSDNILDMNVLLDREPGLAAAVDELKETFRGGNIDSLVTLIDPKINISVFLRGKYDYSISSTDFVDLTRDAIRSTETISFDITRIHERAAGVYVVSGEQTYKSQDGGMRKVYFSYVLEDLAGYWTLTQVGTSPDHIQNW